MNHRLTAVIAAITVAVLWGLSFLSTKTLLKEIPPMEIAFTRFFIASVILYSLMRKQEPGSRLSRSDIPLMAITGFTGTTLYFIFENTGLKYTTASNAVLIIAAIPAVSVVIDHLIHKVKTTAMTLAGVIISISGVIAVIGPETLDLSSQKARGNLLMLGAAAAWIAFNEAAGPLFKRYSKLALTTYSTIAGTLLLLPCMLFEYRDLGPLSPLGWAHIGYLALLCSAAGYFLYLYALDKLGTTTVTSYLNLIPIIGVLGSVVYLHEELRPIQIIGGAIILIGVYLVTAAPNGATDSMSA